MAREYAVYVNGPKGDQVCILPDEEIPSWAVDQLDERHFSDGGGVPPKNGKGSGVKAWEAYAVDNAVDFEAGATKEEIIAACDAAGVPTE